jgi:hypothetical protein
MKAGRRPLASVIVGISALLSACGSSDESDADALELGTSEQALCQNDGGVNGVLAAIAVAAANEMRRWLPTRDFRWNATTGMLELSTYAFPRCRDNAATVGCPNTKALLDLQNWAASGRVTFPGGVKLDSWLLRSRLKSLWDAQVACNDAGNCPVDYHDLKFHHTEAGPCGTRYFYDAFEMNTLNPLTAEHAQRFSNQLLFLGHPNNDFLAFSVENERASVDPTFGLNSSSQTTTGSCSPACTRISTANLNGACCSCNGSYRRYYQSSWSTSTYLCQ